MKLAWQADCMFLFLRWKRNTWISKVSFGFRFNSAPQSKCSSRDFSERISPDRGLVGAITEILIESEVRVQIHGNPVQLFAICLFSVPADPTYHASRKKEMETKYPGEW
jgi:hypothetical protein